VGGLGGFRQYELEADGADTDLRPVNQLGYLINARLIDPGAV
jgi:hypothetical protein